MHNLRYKDISIKPLYSPINRDNVDLNATIEFPHSKKIYNGVPLILAGLWSLEHIQQMTGLGVMSAHGMLPVDELVSYYRHVDLTHRTIYEIDMSNQEEVVNFFTVKSQVIDETKMKYVRLNFDRVSDDAAVAALKNFRLIVPNMVIIAGPCMIHHYARAYGAAGADIVALGHPLGYPVIHSLNVHGVSVSEVELIRQHYLRSGDVILADTWCTTPGDVVKCLALGADFVGIGPDLQKFTIEEILDGIRFVCSMYNVSNITEFRRVVTLQGLPEGH